MRLSIVLFIALIGQKNTVSVDSMAHLVIAPTASINGLRSPFENHMVTAAQLTNIYKGSNSLGIA